MSSIIPAVLIIRLVAAAYGLPPESMIALAKAESGLNPHAIGDNGTSYGLFQIQGPNSHSETYKSLARWASLPEDADLLDPMTNTIMICAMHRKGYGAWSHAWADVPEELRPPADSVVFSKATENQLKEIGVE